MVRDENRTSCLMLKTTLYLPMEIQDIIQPRDLGSIGVDTDSHITLFYKKGLPEVPKENILKDISEFLGEPNYLDFLDTLKEPDLMSPIPELFELGCFNRPDRDWLVLKLKKDTEEFRLLNRIHSDFMEKYDIKSDFPEYNPHITLCDLHSGLAKKYLENKQLALVLNDGCVSFDDLTLSYGDDANDNYDSYTQWCITSFHAASRLIRSQKKKKNQEI